MNALALETLPIFLDRIVTSATAILLSVTAVLLFSEVIPQAICIGPQQLAIAECTAPLVNFLCWLSAPVTWPIAKSLDCLLGEHKLVRYDNEKLKALVKMHCIDCLKNETHHDVTDNGLDRLQIRMIQSAITSKAKVAHEIEKQISSVYMLSWDQEVTPSLIN